MSDTAEPQVNPQRDSAVSVRLCTEVDLAVILEIEQVCYSTPWNRPAFVHELHNPHGRFLVAEQTRPVHYVKPSGEIVKKAAKKIVGYLCSWLILDEAHILNLAVHPDYRGCGIAQTLLRQTLTQASQAGACSANLEVRQSNQAAIAVYRKFGFETVTVRRKYYENREDGLLMVCSLKNKDKHRKQ